MAAAIIIPKWTAPANDESARLKEGDDGGQEAP